MTTFEESVVECYYNLKGYFTIKNIQFSAIEKRRGGKGRGEIDLLAVKIGKNGKVDDAMRVEISVSVSSTFPFISKKRINVDEVWRLLKKFFISDADVKIKEYLKDLEWRNQLISSDFDAKTKERLKTRLEELGAKVEALTQSNGSLKLKIRFEDKVKEIEIVPFPDIWKKLRQIFKEQKLLKKNFQDQVMRGIQHFVRNLGRIETKQVCESPNIRS